jgi:hypothetical protein
MLKFSSTRVQLFSTHVDSRVDSRVSRPIRGYIDGNKRRFPRAPVSWNLSLEPELCTVDSSRRTSREAARGAARTLVHVLVRAHAALARACTFSNIQNSTFQINSSESPCMLRRLASFESWGHHPGQIRGPARTLSYAREGSGWVVCGTVNPSPSTDHQYIHFNIVFCKYIQYLCDWY